jgi:hypothetical protein
MTGTPFNSDRTMLRHAVATMVYRGAKTLRDVPQGFAGYRVQAGSRSPAEILAHIGDLFDWALSMAEGKPRWQDSDPLSWEKEVARFYTAVTAFDTYVAGSSPVACPIDRLFQGPVADAITHAGQLAMLRHLFGAPIQGENYYVADIAIGRVGPDQAPPRKVF